MEGVTQWRLYFLWRTIDTNTKKTKLSHEHVTSPPRKKSRIAYRVQIVDSKEDEERTCWKEMGSGNDGKL